MIITAPRATSIIYNYLMTNSNGGYYLLPVNICPFVPLAFLKAGVEFEFVDISGLNFCVGYDQLIDHLSNEDCEGMVFVYTYGIEFDSGAFFSRVKSKRKDFKIIEDKCLNVPSFSLNDSSPHASFTLYSTGYAKYCDLGYGGFAISHAPFNYEIHPCTFKVTDLELITKQYKNALINGDWFEYDHDLEWLDNGECKWSQKEYHTFISEEIRKVKTIKADMNLIYGQFLPAETWLIKDWSLSATWRFQIRVPQRDSLLNKIFSSSLFASNHYKCLDGIFSTHSSEVGVARQLEKEILNLFNDRNFTKSQAHEICKIINDHLSNID